VKRSPTACTHRDSYSKTPPHQLVDRVRGLLSDLKFYFTDDSTGSRNHIVRFSLPVIQETVDGASRSALGAKSRRSRRHAKKSSNMRSFALWISVLILLVHAALFVGMDKDLVGGAMVYALGKIVTYVSALSNAFNTGFSLGDRWYISQDATLDDTVETQAYRALEEQRLQTDFALRANGARIVCEITTGCYVHPLSIPGLWSSPDYAITDSAHCWSPRTSPGQLGIQLAAFIHPTHFTVEINRPDALFLEMVLWGLIDGADNELEYRTAIAEQPPLPIARERPGLPPVWSNLGKLVFVPLAYVRLNLSSDVELRTVPVFDHIRVSHISFSIVALEILDTGEGKICINRVRVHGDVSTPHGRHAVSGIIPSVAPFR
jgi:hypothetical protein